MRKKLFSILALLLTVTQGAWAQTTADIGRVIAADGKMYKTVTLANKVSTASGVVAYVGTAGSVETGNSTYCCIALSLNNIVNPSPRNEESNLISRYCTKNAGHCNGNYDYCSSLSDALANSAKYGIAATANMIANNDLDAHYHGHQAAVYGCSSSYNNVARPSGASAWSIPSLAQWNMMAKALTGCGDLTTEFNQNTECTYDKLSAKFTAVGAEGFEYARYWSSTEYSSDRAWTFYPNDRGVLAQDRYKDDSQNNSVHVRAMFAFTSASNAYVVEYNANGGSGAPTAESKTHGTALTLSSIVPTRTGYTFLGWNTQADGNGTSYSAGGSYTTDNDVVLYAKWTPTYNATFAAGNDNTGWTIDPASGAEGTTVTVSYEGENKVKSVTVKAKPICALSAVTSAHVGKVIGADGNVYNTVAQANTATTACGVIAYVGAGGSVYSDRSDLKAIAISLADAPGGSMNWGPTDHPIDYGTTSTDYSTLLSNMGGAYTNERAVGCTYSGCTGHPALQAAWNYSTAKPSGTSMWFMPCIGQWNLIVKGLTGSGSDLSNATNSALAYDKVSAKLTAAGASSLSNNHYWLSNEYSNDEAWEYMPEGYLDKVGKGFSWAVRPIFCF